MSRRQVAAALRGPRLGDALLLAAQTAAPQKPVAQPAAQAPARSTKAPAKPAAGAAEFDRLVKAATEARQAERWDEAIGLYAKALKLKPGYVEGHWYQGTAYYTLDDHTRVPRGVSQRRAARAEERRGATPFSVCASSG